MTSEPNTQTETGDTIVESPFDLLHDMENAINRSLSGMRVDMMEWIDLINRARVVLEAHGVELK